MSDFITRSSDLTMQWDDYYRSAAQTPWEMIDFSDLPSFLKACELPLDRLASMASVGCGRGHRDLAMLREVAAFNRTAFSYLGVDISSVAIAQARQLFGGASHATDARVAQQPKLDCAWAFQHADLFEFQPSRRFDLVLDWMCLHDIERDRLPDYAARLAALSREYLVIKAFSQEGSSVARLGLLGRDIQKEKIAEDDVLRLFGDQFEILFIQQYEEDLDPVPRPPDGIVAAKRAYVLRRARPLEAGDAGPATDSAPR